MEGKRVRRGFSWAILGSVLGLLCLLPGAAWSEFDTKTRFDPTAAGDFTGATAVTGISSWDWQETGTLVIEEQLPAPASNEATTLTQFFATAVRGDTLSYQIHGQARLRALSGGTPSPAPGLATEGSGSGVYEVTATFDGIETAVFGRNVLDQPILYFVGITGTFQYYLDHSPDSVVTTGVGFNDGAAGLGGAPFLRATLIGVDGEFNGTTGSGSVNIFSRVDDYNPLIIEADSATPGVALVGSTFHSNIRVERLIGLTPFLQAGGVAGDAPYTTTSADLRLNIDASSTFVADYVTAAIGDFVWEDLNRNGIQEAGEPGIAGVTVELYDCDDTFVASTTTDSDGFYLFDGLTPGDYYLVFVQPDDYHFTLQDQGGDDELNSDADPNSGSTICTTLAPGQTDLSWDAGLYRPAALGDRVWEDLNGNGLQDAGELGVPGVTVKLYDCVGNFIAETTTDANGLYLFTGLVPGSYYVVFMAPTGYEFTSQNAGMDEAIDSDADAFGVTACVTLTSGETNLDVDAGLVAIEYAAIGDFVWKDLNRNGIQDAGEPGIEGVLVKLYDCEGNKLAEMYTDENGNYLFDGLMVGNYNLKFTAPVDYFFTLQNAGGDPEKDSDADSNGLTVCTTLAPGETDLSWDAGLWTPMPVIDIEKATNGEDADLPTGPFIPVGDPVTWTYVVTNIGNVPLQGVVVTDDQGVTVTCSKTTLDVGEVMTCTASGTAMLGQYANLGTVVGYDDYGNEVTDADPSHYYGTMDAPGTGTPGYWKNHPNAWPVDEIIIGGVTYSKDMAIGLMGCPDGNKLFTMFRALVAAKLNVLVGNDASCIAGTIAAADAWIADNAPDGMPTACKGDPKVKASSYAWRIGEPMYWMLDDYNNGLLCAPSRDSME